MLWLLTSVTIWWEFMQSKPRTLTTCFSDVPATDISEIVKEVGKPCPSQLTHSWELALAFTWTKKESWPWRHGCGRAISNCMGAGELAPSPAGWLTRESWSCPSPGQRGRQLWWHGCRKTDRLINSTTAQAQIQGFALPHPTPTSSPSRLCWSVWRDWPCRSIAAGSLKTQGNSRISESLYEGPVLTL